MLMNKLQTIRNDKFYISSIIASFSALVIIASWSIYSQPHLEPDFAAKREMDIKQCVNFAKHKGFSTKQEGTSVVEMTLNTLSAPKLMFAEVETVIAGCHNIELKSFCIGVSSECGVDGIKMVMVYEGGSVY